MKFSRRIILSVMLRTHYITVFVRERSEPNPTRQKKKKSRPALTSIQLSW